jgi:ornithine--oxo-acid transaminase
LGCAVAVAALDVLVEEGLTERSLELGQYFIEKLREINNPLIKEIRGRGLFIGLELKTAARPYCEQLKERGLLCKETHETTIRFAPPLVISKEDLDWAIERIKQVLEA